MSRKSEKIIGSRSVLSNSFFNQSFSPVKKRKIDKEVALILKGIKKSGDTTIVIYEGGLTELILASSLARAAPNCKIIYNFHSSDIWSSILAAAESDEASNFVKEYISSVNASRPNIRFTSESQNLSELIRDSASVSVGVFPIFTTLPEQLFLSNAHERRGLPKDPGTSALTKASSLLIFLGDERMASFVKSLVGLLSEKLEISIHIHVSSRLMNLRLETSGWGDKITSSSGELTSFEYFQLLNQSQLTLLAYEPFHYRFHSSGRIEDAFFCGSSPIVPEGTALVNQGGGPPVNTFDRNSVTDSVIRIGEYLEEGRPLRSAIGLKDFYVWLAEEEDQLTLRGKGCSNEIPIKGKMFDSVSIPTSSLKLKYRDSLIRLGVPHMWISRLLIVLSRLRGPL